MLVVWVGNRMQTENLPTRHHHVITINIKKVICIIVALVSISYLIGSLTGYSLLVIQ